MKTIKDFEICEFGRPNEPGVYIVCTTNYPWYEGKEHILYIGSSLNMGKRIENRRHPYRISIERFNNSLVYVKFLYTSDYKNIESELISTYKPIINKNMKWR